MVQLSPFPADRFQSWYENMLADYAENRVRAGSWAPDGAVERARDLYRELLPDGVDTFNQYLALILNERAEEVGTVWYAPSLDGGVAHLYVYDLLIHERFRRQGYGAQTLSLLETYAKHAGLSRIVLHVFGHNGPARALYQQSGFIETSVMMAKEVV